MSAVLPVEVKDATLKAVRVLVVLTIVVSVTVVQALMARIAKIRLCATIVVLVEMGRRDDGGSSGFQYRFWVVILSTTSAQETKVGYFLMLEMVEVGEVHVHRACHKSRRPTI